MKINADTPNAKDIHLFDVTGNKLVWVQEFDTETCEAVMLLPLAVNKNDMKVPVMHQALDAAEPEPLAIKIRIPGAYALDASGARL